MLSALSCALGCRRRPPLPLQFLLPVATTAAVALVHAPSAATAAVRGPTAAPAAIAVLHGLTAAAAAIPLARCLVAAAAAVALARCSGCCCRCGRAFLPPLQLRSLSHALCCRRCRRSVLHAPAVAAAAVAHLRERMLIPVAPAAACIVLYDAFLGFLRKYSATSNFRR